MFSDQQLGGDPLFLGKYATRLSESSQKLLMGRTRLHDLADFRTDLGHQAMQLLIAGHGYQIVRSAGDRWIPGQNARVPVF